MRCTVFALRTQRDTARAERDAALAVIENVRQLCKRWSADLGPVMSGDVVSITAVLATLDTPAAPEEATA